MSVCCVQIVEVICEHRFYEKTFVVETRPAGERELTDRQRVRSSHVLISRVSFQSARFAFDMRTALGKSFAVDVCE